MSDTYLGLYGNQYGYEDSEGVSPTERAYDLVQKEWSKDKKYVKARIKHLEKKRKGSISNK